MTSVVNMTSASEAAALLVKNASLKDAANQAAMKLRYARGVKEEQLVVVVAYLSGSDVFAVLPTGFGKSLCYAFLHFAFELLGETEEKPTVVVVTPLTAIIVTYLICIKLYECHPHTSGLHKSKYCVIPDPFPVERFGKGSGYARLAQPMKNV